MKISGLGFVKCFGQPRMSVIQQIKKFVYIFRMDFTDVEKLGANFKKSLHPNPLDI